MVNSIESFFFTKTSYIHFTNAKEAYAIYQNETLDLLSLKKFNKGIEQWNEEWNELKIHSSLNYYMVMHLAFEYGYQFHHISLPKLAQQKPLAYVIYYQNKISHQKNSINNTKEKLKISFDAYKIPTYISYQKQFNHVMDALERGDCYQLNLTNQFLFKFNDKDIIKKLQARFFNANHLGQMSHITHMPNINLSIFSNSPECLFKINFKNKKYFLETFPIKGTARNDQNGKISKINLSKLKTDKNKTELRIITDLMRNDLTKITLNSSDVVKNECLLKVPHLIHLYSMIRSEMNSNLSLLKILTGIFPGGSITGAPKKRVLELINSIESKPRGLYTGSTLIWDKNIQIASINIRTLELDSQKRLGSYGSGGGITLSSRCQSEYQEMKNKVESFTSNFFH